MLEQIIEIPINHRLIVDLPFAIPIGRAKLTINVTPEFEPPSFTKRETAESLCGSANGSKLTLERFMEMRQEEIELEIENDRRLWDKQ
jgi:hypothetical protein